ncbi:MAG: ATP-binding protein [Elusimicrobiaceae bacterium]|nr:ATP-binding protein [Elusimicrobiaceae bacterium]
MISNYEIRENSLTQNSVYLLLLKADEKGCKDIQRDLAGHCKLIKTSIPGFNYIFELSGITDEKSLEKIKTRVEFLSSNGITETFNNSSRTLTIDLSASNLGGGEQRTGKGQNTMRKNEDSFINLADTGFPVSKEERTETVFRDLITSTSLVSGDEKNINIGNTSLELAKTFTDIQQKEPSVVEKENKPEKETPDIEQNNEKIFPPSSKEIEDVQIVATKEEMGKTGLLGNIVGKIKTAIHTTKENREQTFSFRKKKSKKINNDLQQKKSTSEQEGDPFQNLGEGIIIKNNVLEEDISPEAFEQKQKGLSGNPVTAKIKVDDIFDAETVCDFYDENQSEGLVQSKENVLRGEKSPLEILENQTDDNEAVQNSFSAKDETLSDVKISLENNKDDDMSLSFPKQIFSQNDLENKEENPREEKTQKTENPPIKDEKINDQKQRDTISEHTENINKKIKETKEEKQQNKFDEEEVKENMKEEKQEIAAASTIKGNNQSLNKTSHISNGAIKKTMKIDHTLHIATPTKDTKYRNYPIEMPLVPTYTFSTMDISAIRFAHAMAMATLDDLGRGNNPFLLQGTSGTGKTHFLHAMGYEISKKIPQAKILFTNGVRFSRGVQYLLEKGQKEKLDNFFSEAEVLIIDDVHLTAVNEHNREYISAVLNDFLKNKKQIILSSKYPPESLKRFEELVNFKFSIGTIAELKVPGKAHFNKLTSRIVTSSFMDLTEKEIDTFFAQKSTSLGDVARNVKRVKVLSRRIESSGIKKLSYEEILQQMTAVNGENSDSDICTKDFGEITALEKNKEGSWGNFGFFFPASQIDKFRWVAFAAQEAAKELGIKGGFNYALKSAYSTDHIISAAFKIANICDLKNLKGAVILGPSFSECKEPIRDNFYDILTHMLEVMMIRCGTINFEDIKKPSAYIKMLGDILR